MRTPARNGRAVTACVPYYWCREHVCRAVDSLLSQTHKDLLVVVVNDGDPEPPWRQLARVRDPRLVRFDLAANHGPYFATAVVLNATSSPYLLIQDADDWSSPTRVERLLRKLESDRSDFAFSAESLHRPNTAGRLECYGFEWRRQPDTTPCPQLRYRMPHHGLWRTQSVRKIGGYYGGFRISYDRFLLNAILLIGRVSHVGELLYHRQLRPDSLTASPKTGINSAARVAVDERLGRIYCAMYQLRSCFLKQEIGSEEYTKRLAVLSRTFVTPADSAALRVETLRLAAVLRGR